GVVAVVADLMRAVAAAVAAGVLPGYFWAAVLAPRAGLAERLTWSSVLSVASVPAVALALAKAAHTGVTLWVAIGAVALVAGSGVCRARARAQPGAATAGADPEPPRARAGPHRLRGGPHNGRGRAA